MTLAAEQDSAPEVNEFSLSIGGMTCGACAVRIERRLNRLDGVEAAVNFAAERARVEVVDDRSVDEVIEAIEAIGFSAEQIIDEAAPSGQDEAERRVTSLGRRLVVAAILLMPISDLSLLMWLVPSMRFPGWQIVLLALSAPVLTWGAWPFYSAAVRHARHGNFSMDTLVSIGIVAATAWSIYAMFWKDASSTDVQHTIGYYLTHHAAGAVYIDVAVGVTTFLLAGRYFEARSRRSTGNALRSLATVGAKDVAIIDADGIEHRRPISALRVGDTFVVRPGEKIATDGVVLTGESSIDRSAMTGESIPDDVKVGDKVLGGTVLVDGRLVVEATSVGTETQLAQMVRLVEDAQNQKAAVQRLADRIAGIFVPAVLLSAVATLIGWLVAGGSIEEALNASLSVLIIACPCALGLATPTALLVASGEGARRGIFFKGYQGLEVSRQIDTVVLDKTGTVTTGQMTVMGVATIHTAEAADVLRDAGALEQASEHLVARAIVAAALEQAGALPAVDEFVASPGLGAEGVVEDRRIRVGRSAFFGDLASVLPTELAGPCDSWERSGHTVVLVSRGEVILGAIAIADTIRPTAAEAVNNLRLLGLRCILLTGDNESTAHRVAESVGIDEVVAGALPTDKVAMISALQAAGHSVAMVGDGINDGPALVASDLGLAIGSGTDVAISAADLIVVRNDLRMVPLALELARKTLRTIRGNLLWAFAYNVAAIPLAALGFLNPLVAGAAMALSSVFVVWNSSRLRNFTSQFDGATMPSPAARSKTQPLAPEGTSPAVPVGAGSD